MTTLLAGLIASSLAIIGKLATQTFFEVLLTKVIIFCGDKLVAMSSNSLDDEIMDEVKKRLSQ